jgi:tetratricopeptide (TPR) repeat protein/lysophospholipase L1-like esterase
MLKLPLRKKVVFYTSLAILPFFLFALLEFALRVFSIGDNLGLFVTSSDSRYFEANQLVGKRFFNKFEQTKPPHDSFLKEKPANGYRIFVLGESTVQGFPYDANLAFTGILQRRLQDVFPEHTIEVVNLGMTAVTSYTLLDFADEILQQKPDLVLIYAGHNEYYGALGVASMENGPMPRWLKKLQLRLVHFRTYQLLQRMVENISQLATPISHDEAKATLMQRMVGKNLIPYHSKMYADGMDQFYENMGDLLSRLKEAHIPVIISDLVSNVRDLSPFHSLQYRDFPKADSLYNDARRLEDDNVYGKAREEYLRAKDLDAIRFRASEEFNTLIVDLADSIGVYHISLKSLFENYSPHGIVGNNLMTEHLHPNIDGCFLMSEGFLIALRERGMIENNWDSTRMKPWTYYRHNWGFTELDSMLAVIRIKHLKAGWPFQPESTVNNFRSEYRPKGIIDSLAFKSVMHENVSSATAHKELAAYYESIGDLRHASKEYLAMAYSSPLNVSSYYYAADLAYKTNDYTDAIRYLNEAPNSDTSAYAQFTLASIYSSQNKLKEALQCIERLERVSSDNKNYLQIQELKYKVLRDSGLSYDAEKTLAVIRKLEPSFDESKRGKSLTVLIPSKIRAYIEKAETLRKQGQFSEALVVLKEANEIQETAYANLLIGKILFSQRNNEALRYMEKAHKEIKDDPSLVFNLCLLYLMKEDMPKAKITMNDFARLEGVNDPKFKQLRALFDQRRRKTK